MKTINVVIDHNNTWNQDDSITSLLLIINGEEAGYLNLNVIGETAEIDGVEIFPKFQKKGYYKPFLKKAMELLGLGELISLHRNDDSNPCYCKWVGDEELGYDSPVSIEIDIDTEELCFSKLGKYYKF